MRPPAVNYKCNGERTFLYEFSTSFKKLWVIVRVTEWIVLSLAVSKVIVWEKMVWNCAAAIIWVVEMTGVAYVTAKCNTCTDESY